VFSRAAAVALLLTCAIGLQCKAAEGGVGKSGSSADEASGSGSGTVSLPVSRKFRKTEFKKDRFTILIPSDYYTVEKGSDVRTYTCSDYPHGIMSVMVATAPEHSSFSPAVLKEFVEKLTPNKKSVDKEGPVKIGELTGTQWDITNNVDSPQNGCQVRGFIVGRKLYVLMAYGTKPWINSTDIKQFMDSFEVMRESD